MRVVIAEDEVLMRQGLRRLLETTGIEVTAEAGDVEGLLAAVDRTRPDAVVTDIKMPPTLTDEGIRAAITIRAQHPGTAILVLSHYVDSGYAMRLMATHEESMGYLLKERVSDLAILVDALHRLVDGESVVDPTIVSRLMHRTHGQAVDRLSTREREILALMAEGYSNRRIGERLFLSPRTVEAHVGHIFTKLDLAGGGAEDRRVLAVLAHLRSLRTEVIPPSPDPG
ncbi:response regulator transcription factor [Pedococcus sp. KACC 23699]|uniref:Response regulator transcription factor n=1 Tax=Pedococcus sp. KACC 23699 TaxID=3149228 RepID=A0AAU7JVB8_9MICO